MTRQEAEDAVYRSYLRAQSYQDRNAPDCEKRRPDLTAEAIRQRTRGVNVLVTGSKGKGSIANMTAAILQQRYCVGLMTSPHLLTFNERFRVDGQSISDEELVGRMEQLMPLIESIDRGLAPEVCISPMGIQTLLALEHFREKNTQVNVLECGKGAAYDDVNNVPGNYGVIGRIFPEHLRELGGSIEQIAADKSHIIQEGMHCVYSMEQAPEVMEILKERARRLGVPLKRCGRDFSAENIRFAREGMQFDLVLRLGAAAEGTVVRYENLSVPLLGGHQPQNGALAVAVAYDIMRRRGDTPKEAEVRAALERLRWPGRMEVLSKDPFLLLDACIHRESAKQVMGALKELKIREGVFVIGIPDDKDYAGVARLVSPVARQMILTKSGNPHYLFTEKQLEVLSAEGIECRWIPDSGRALQEAASYGLPVIVLGTTSVVAEVSKWMEEKE